MTDTATTGTAMTGTAMTDTATTDTAMTDTAMTDTAMTDTTMTDTASTGTAGTGAHTVRLAGVFTTSLAIFGRHFVRIVLVMAVARLIPYYLTQRVIEAAADLDGVRLVTAVSVLGNLVGLITGALAGAMVTYGAVQELTGGRFSAGQSFAAVLRRPLPVIGVALCVEIAVFLGYVLLIVPGVIAACVWCVSLPACLAERTGVFQSLVRSRLLTRGYRWRVFGAVARVTLIPLAVYVAGRISAWLAILHDEAPGFFAATPITQLVILSSVSTAFGAVPQRGGLLRTPHRAGGCRVQQDHDRVRLIETGMALTSP